jgi:tetratricopeptide repeat protein 21B
MKLDPNGAYEPALYGLIKCQVIEGQLDEAARQLEFLMEVSAAKEPELTFLSALLAWRFSHDRERAVKLLTETVDLHFKQLNDISLG